MWIRLLIKYFCIDDLKWFYCRSKGLVDKNNELDCKIQFLISDLIGNQM